MGRAPVSEPVAVRRARRSPNARRRKVDDQHGCGTHRSHAARNLRHASRPPPLPHRNLYRPQAGGRHAHLHLQIPAERLLAHAEARQRVAADGAEGRHVGEARAVKKTDEQAGQMARHDLRRRQATRLTISQQARSQHEIGAAALDGCQHRRDHPRPVAAVAIDEEDDGAVRRGGGDARHHGAAVAPLRLDHDPCAGGSRALDCAILRPAVDDDDLADALSQHRGHARADRLLLVQAGDDGGDVQPLPLPILFQNGERAGVRGGRLLRRCTGHALTPC